MTEETVEPAPTFGAQINFTDEKFIDHNNVIGYALNSGAVSIYDNSRSTHIYPLHSIKNITINYEP